MQSFQQGFLVSGKQNLASGSLWGWDSELLQGLEGHSCAGGEDNSWCWDAQRLQKIPQPKPSSAVGMHINTNKFRRTSGLEVSWQKAALSSRCCWNKGSWKVGVTANTACWNYGEQRNRNPLCTLWRCNMVYSSGNGIIIRINKILMVIA